MGEWVNPNHIGVDIGCGMLCAEIKSVITPDMYMDIERKIREVVPMGFAIHSNDGDVGSGTHLSAVSASLVSKKCKGIEQLVEKIGMSMETWVRSLGTLGGGNHFIELGRSEKTGSHYLTIHSGSRNFGKRVCDYHAKSSAGHKLMLGEEMERIKQTLPKQQWEAAIKEASKRIREREGYLTGKAKEEYLADMYFAQVYAAVNRNAMLLLIEMALGLVYGEIIETTHNYINPKDGIIRKGAVSAYEGEKLVIPMNMADGILLCRGKGNPDWNYSAPHGAGRLYSRTAAKENLSMEEFQERMKDVYSTSVCESTLDESPMAYKSTEEIRSLIEPTVEILDVIKPVINLKAIE